MKILRLLTVAALAAFFSSAHALESDKKQHAGVSFFLGFAMANQFPNEPLKAWGLAMVPGLLKELADSQKGGTGFSGSDLAANAVGAALGVTTGRWLLMRKDGATVIAYRSEW